MSYESSMRISNEMPSAIEIEKALLIALFNNKGKIKEFSIGESIVDELANYFQLNKKQRSATLERLYRKENRIVKSPLWHRLLYRAASALSKKNMISNPASTFKLTGEKEWMLTEKGYDEVLRLLMIPVAQKEALFVNTFEVQNISKKLINTSRPKNYNPIDKNKVKKIISKNVLIRKRGFRQAVIESYDYKCSVCGLKLSSPQRKIWEVEAAHIVPVSFNGKDDLLNGIALCHMHHWAFDVGWFTLANNYRIILSPEKDRYKDAVEKMGSWEFINSFTPFHKKISLPSNLNILPHLNALDWHRENIFNKK